MTDESEERGETRLRTAFGALREVDATSAPPFERTWAAAERRARGRSRRVAVTAVAAGLGAVVVAAAAAAIVVTAWPSSEPDDGRALAATVAGMRSEPLAFLLAPPSASVLTSKAPFAFASETEGAW